MPDHVHLLVEIDPQFGIHRLIKNINGVSSHVEKGGCIASHSPHPVLLESSSLQLVLGREDGLPFQ